MKKSEDSLCSVSPESGDLEPHESMIITVKLCLVEPGKYKDKIMLRVINSRTIPVEVKGTGYGCSVVFEPQIFPTFDWGLLFRFQSFIITPSNYSIDRNVLPLDICFSASIFASLFVDFCKPQIIGKYIQSVSNLNVKTSGKYRGSIY